MEIIKQGKDITAIRYSFVCPVCECEFIASKDELYGENYAGCPNCGAECNGEIIE